MTAWPPDTWRRALRATGSTSWAVAAKKAECTALAARHGWRVWAFNLGCRPGSTNHPKGWVAAPEGVFGAAYLGIPPEQRHAYEVIERACSLYFDLECCGELLATGDAMAQQVEAAARESLAELAAEQGCASRSGSRPSPPMRRMEPSSRATSCSGRAARARRCSLPARVRPERSWRAWWRAAARRPP